MRSVTRRVAAGLDVFGQDRRECLNRLSGTLQPKRSALDANTGVRVQSHSDGFNIRRMLHQPAGQPIHVGVSAGHRQRRTFNVHEIILGIDDEQVK